MDKTRIAFIDLDGVLVDNTAREVDAIHRTVEHFNISNFTDNQKIMAGSFLRSRYPQVWNEIFFSKEALYSPELIAQDEVQDGAREALDVLTQHGFSVIFLTSRPDTKSCREATEKWLAMHGFQLDVPCSGIPGHDALIMKPQSLIDARVTTRAYKASTIEMFANTYQADSVLIIDDDERNAETIMQLANKHKWTLQGFVSLQEAVEALQDEEEC